MNYYNEIDPKLCAWIQELINEKLIPDGKIDGRSIADVQPSDLDGFTQCHFFTGIAGWSLALRLAGWPDDREIWSGSCPCFPAGTLIITSDGYKPIESVVPGDMVLTHVGRFMPVSHVGSEIAECVTVKGQGHPGLTCTSNHPFFARKSEGKSLGATGWVEAGSLVGNRWATVASIPVIKQDDFKSEKLGVFYDKSVSMYRAKGENKGEPVYIGVYETKDEAVAARASAVANGTVSVRGADGVDVTTTAFARFLGYWLGDGWCSRGSVFLCGSKEDTDLLNQLFSDIGLGASAYVEKTSSRIRCGSHALSKWLTRNFGEYAHGKRIPVWLHGMPEGYRRAFLDGYILADGYEGFQQKGGGRFWSASTTSRAVAIGVRVLFNQLGKSASIRKVTNARKKCVIEGRTVNENSYYKITAYESARSFRFDGIHGWGKVRSVTPAGIHKVYNLAVDGDESYTADGIVVHNCQPFSCAGKQLGAADERHLWPEFYRLIRECRPAICVGEQVASAAGRDWLSGVRADLETLAYEVGAADLCAASVQAPHIRQRLWWMAYADSKQDYTAKQGQRMPGEGLRTCRLADAELSDRRTEQQEHGDSHGGDGSGRSSDDGRLADATSRGLGTDRSAPGSAGHTQQREQVERVGDTINPGLEGHARDGHDGHQPGRNGADQTGPVAEASHFSGWGNTWHPCSDGKARRIPPGSQSVLQRLFDVIPDTVDPVRTASLGFPLALKVPHRTTLLKGYGNSINATLAAEFVKAVMQTINTYEPQHTLKT